MTSPFLCLLVRRADDDQQPDDGRHVVLSVQPEITCVLETDGRPSVHGLDTADPATWRTLTLNALDLAGALARIALDVLPDLGVTGMEHGCDYYRARPVRNLPYEPDSGYAELTRGEWLGDGFCHLWLSTRLDKEVIAEGEMPYMQVTIPRNRVRAWTARLEAAVNDLARNTAESLAIEGVSPE